MKAKKTKKNM